MNKFLQYEFRVLSQNICRYCMNACPFGVPHFDYDKGIIPGAFIDKCTFCTQRIDVGLDTRAVAK